MFSKNNINRRLLLKAITGGLATTSLPIKMASAQNKKTRYSMNGFKVDPIKKVRIIVIGIGKRGKTAIARLVRIPNIEIVAIVELRKKDAQWADKIIRRYMPDQKPPVIFYDNPQDFHKAYEMDFDLAYICTPWEWHVTMAVAAMKAGAHTAVEVPISTTLKGCWELVHTAEQTQRHCMMLENVCYSESEMAVRNMCQDGVFGDLVHGEAAYLHDLRRSLVDKKMRYPERWRLAHSIKRNGNLYPTHGFGPVSQYMDLNNSDRAVSLVSMSSSSLGIQDLAKRDYGNNSPESQLGTLQGDVNTTLIRTKLGRTIMVQFSTGAPRPYNRLNLIQGTRGIFSGYPDKIALDPHPHKWDDNLWKKLLKKYRDKEWRNLDQFSRKSGGHGGMDTVMDRRLIHNLHTGNPMDISLYDSVLWSAISPLSELSVSKNSSPIAIPDFIA